MKRITYKIKEILKFFGLNPLAAFNNFRGLPLYFMDLKKIKKQKGKNTDFPFGSPCIKLNDRFSKSGTMSGQYFLQDLHVARKIYENKPVKHVDIGSRIDGFISHLACFREVEIIDVRPQVSKIKNIICRQADMILLPEDMIGYCDSVSALHSIEHFGLGRYGDTVDYYGHIKAIHNIHKILQKKGIFYFSVPIGPQRIEFNGHRIFSVKYLISILDALFYIENFSYIDDDFDLHTDVNLSEEKIEVNYNCNFGIGIFVLRKK